MTYNVWNGELRMVNQLSAVPAELSNSEAWRNLFSSSRLPQSVLCTGDREYRYTDIDSPGSPQYRMRITSDNVPKIQRKFGTQWFQLFQLHAVPPVAELLFHKDASDIAWVSLESPERDVLYAHGNGIPELTLVRNTESWEAFRYDGNCHTR